MISIKVDKQGVITNVAFTNDAGLHVYADDQFYYTYELDGQDYKLIGESMHQAKICPVQFFWSDNLSSADKIVKESPITGIVGKLDEYLFHHTKKGALDLSSAAPIWWTEQTECEYHEPVSGNACQFGIVILTSGVPMKCPLCSSRRLLGPGSVIEKPRPMPNSPEMGDPIGMVPVDSNALNYNKDESVRLKDDIFEVLTGKTNEGSSRYALNEDQVKSNVESQTNIINGLARTLEKSYKFIIDIMLTIRYSDSYTGSEINFGYEHYVQTVEDATKDYKAAKDSGLPAYILADKRNKIEGVLGRSDANKRNRFKILKAIDPFPDHTAQEVQAFISIGLPVELLYKKLQFSYLISRFEAEYVPVEEFIPSATFKFKIDFITNKINEYVKQEIASGTSAANPSSPGDGSGEPTRTSAAKAESEAA